MNNRSQDQRGWSHRQNDPRYVGGEETADMTESAELEEVAVKVRAAAETCGAMIIDNVPSKGTIPDVILDADHFPTLIERVKPRLVYVFQTKFDARMSPRKSMSMRIN
jgi:hypothetical protein